MFSADFDIEQVEKLKEGCDRCNKVGVKGFMFTSGPINLLDDATEVCLECTPGWLWDAVEERGKKYEEFLNERERERNADHQEADE